MRPFKDRRDAGARLARELHGFFDAGDVIVLALPRGGVPVGYEVATRLGAPLDVLIVRKLGTPRYPELAMGAIASGGVEIVDHEIVAREHVSPAEIERILTVEREELARREALFRLGRPPLDVAGKIVLLVDDGLATGSTMFAAIEAVRMREPDLIVVAVPVASPQTLLTFRERGQQFVCLHAPQHMYAVGDWYLDFEQTTDAEVRELLAAAERMAPAGNPYELRLP